MARVTSLRAREVKIEIGETPVLDGMKRRNP